MKSFAALFTCLALIVLAGCDSNPEGPAAPTASATGAAAAGGGAADQSPKSAKSKTGRKLEGPGAAQAN